MSSVKKIPYARKGAGVNDFYGDIMGFITMGEVRMRFKSRKSNFQKGYYEGYNNPKRSLESINKVLVEGRLKTMSPKGKDFFEGLSMGYEDRLKS